MRKKTPVERKLSALCGRRGAGPLPPEAKSAAAARRLAVSASGTRIPDSPPPGAIQNTPTPDSRTQSRVPIPDSRTKKSRLLIRAQPSSSPSLCPLDLRFCLRESGTRSVVGRAARPPEFRLPNPDRGHVPYVERVSAGTPRRSAMLCPSVASTWLHLLDSQGTKSRPRRRASPERKEYSVLPSECPGLCTSGTTRYHAKCDECGYQTPPNLCCKGEAPIDACPQCGEEMHLAHMSLAPFPEREPEFPELGDTADSAPKSTP